MNIVKYSWALVLLCAVNTSAQNWLWANAPGSVSQSAGAGYNGVWGGQVKTGPGNSLFASMYNAGSNVSIGPYVFYDTALYYGSPFYQTIVAKYDLSGNSEWAIASNNGSAVPFAITPDDSGNLYVFGQILTDSVQFGPYYVYNLYNPSPLMISRSYYLLKITDAGDVAWVRYGHADSRGLGWSGMIYGGLITDKSNHIYLATSVDSGIILAKFDIAGNVLWSKKCKGDIEQQVTGIAAYNDRIYLAGNFQSSQFIIGHDTLSYTGPPYAPGSTATNSYMASFDTGGNAVWAISSPSLALINDLKADINGNLYACGHVLVGPYMIWGRDSVVIPTEGQAGLLVSVDTNGSTRWLKVFPQKIPYYSMWTANDVYNMTIDACNHLWLSGAIDTPAGIVLDSTVLFDTVGSSDPMLIAEYTNSGLLLNAFTLPSGGISNNGVGADAFGNIYLCGSYSVLDPFLIGTNALHLDNGESRNVFLAKLNPTTGIDLSSVATMCPGDMKILYGPQGYSQYYWSTNADADSVIVNSGGNYTAWCYSGCELKATDNFTVSEIILNPFVQDTSLCRESGNSILLDPQAPNGSSVLWNTNQNSASITISEPGSYSAIISEDGCSVTDTFNVNEYPCNCIVSLPNSFTPNDDGKNDLFGVVKQQGCEFESFTFVIYNRWGNLIFKTNDPLHPWDGKHHGKLQDMGTYMYDLQFKTNYDQYERHLKGTVTLVR